MKTAILGPIFGKKRITYHNTSQDIWLKIGISMTLGWLIPYAPYLPTFG